MQICPVCGKQLSDDITECPVCGCPLDQPPLPPVTAGNKPAIGPTPPPPPPPLPPLPPTTPAPPTPVEPDEPKFEEPRRHVWLWVILFLVIAGGVAGLIVWGVSSRHSSSDNYDEIDSLLNSGYEDTEEVVATDSAAEPDFNYYESPGADYSTDDYDMPVADSVAASDWEYSVPDSVAA